MVALYNWAFFHCTGLSSLTFEEGITYIGSYVFGDCPNLKSVSVPLSIVLGYYNTFGWNYDESNDSNYPTPGFTVYGYSGSWAEQCAEYNEFKFISLGSAYSDMTGDMDGNLNLDIRDAEILYQQVAGIQ